VTDAVLATLVGVLAAAVLAAATLAGAYLLRRIQELADRLLAVEIALDRLQLMEEDAKLRGRQRARRG
jgi:hypothetical protein